MERAVAARAAARVVAKAVAATEEARAAAGKAAEMEAAATEEAREVVGTDWHRRRHIWHMYWPACQCRIARLWSAYCT